MRRNFTDRATEDGLYQPGDGGAGLLPTALSADALNNLQEEICTVIEEAGLTVTGPEDAVDYTQLLQAIQAIVTAAAGPHVTQLLEGKWFHTTEYNATYYQKPAGQSLLRADWPEAWAAIQTSGMLAVDHATWLTNKTLWGPGVDTDHFDMLDLRAVFLRIDNDGKVGALGPALGHFKANQNVEHVHPLPSYSNDDTGDGAVADSTGTGTHHTADSDPEGGDEAVPDHTTSRYVIRLK